MGVEKCKMCKTGNLFLLKSMVVADTHYDIMRCEKCGHEFAKNMG